MKIQTIENSNDSYYHKNSFSKNSKRNPNFRGIVNGRYFENEIIKEAKEAFSNPNWKRKFLEMKTSVGETLSTWHDRDNAGIGGRIIGAICSFGLTEIGFGLVCTLQDQADNKMIDKKIEAIEDCIEEFKKGGGPEKTEYHL